MIQKAGGLQLLEMTFGLHTGQYFKMPGKILAFFISLLIALLPVTGFLVWWGRRKKPKKMRLDNAAATFKGNCR